jgi:hypothetical protein
MKHDPPTEPHPLEPLGNLRRRRFLTLAAFASTSVVAVGVAAASPAQAAPQPQPHAIDADTGWPVFPEVKPPNGYTRTYLPCDDGDYVDVPNAAMSRARDNAAVLRPPFRLADWNRAIGGQR